MSDDVNTGHILSTEITPTPETVKFEDISRDQEESLSTGIIQKALNYPEMVSLYLAAHMAAVP